MRKLIQKIMKIFKDILTENGMYSQSRIYLLWAIIAYYVTLGLLLAGGLNKTTQLDIEKFKIIIDALEYAMVLFAGYTFGGKFLGVIKTIGIHRKEDKKEEVEGN